MKTTDFTKSFQDMMANLPIDTSSVKEAFKTQSALAEKLTKLTLEAAEASTEISARWTKDTLARMGELSTAKDQPADYAKAAQDFATAAAERASENIQAYAEVAKKLQMQTVDLMLTAGKDLAEDAQETAQKIATKTQEATRAATTAARKAADTAKA